MLKNVHPLLNADVLYALRAMGHGDDLVLVDRNFPSESVAQETSLGQVLRIDRPIVEVVAAVLQHYPLDTFVEDSVAVMQVVGEPDTVLPVQREIQAAVDATQEKQFPAMFIERFAFYERAKAAFAIIQTSEARFYGNVALRKGVLPPED